MAGVLIFSTGRYAEPREALRYFGRELACTDTEEESLGSLFLTSDDAGYTITAKRSDGEIRLVFQGHGLMSENYASPSGQTLIFDGEVAHSQIFGAAGGYCL